MRNNAKFLLHFLVLAVFFLFSGAAVYAQETSETANKPLENNLKIDTAKESTVRLVGLPGGGTGFFIAPDKIATNFHVVVMCKIGPIFAKLGHKETIWTIEGVMAFDAESDIAILKVKGEGTPLPLADIETLQIGETVFLAGYPNLAAYDVMEGVLQDIRGSDKWLKTTLQREAYPGTSGSPVLNSKGEVIGIHAGHGYDTRPSSALKALLANSTSIEPLEQWRKRKVVRTYSQYLTGLQLYSEGNFEKAIEHFNKAIEFTPDDAESYKYRAKAKAALGHLTEAIADYNQVIKLNPDDVDAYKGRGEVKRKLDDYAGAIEDYTHAIERNPNDAYAYKNRADAKHKLQDYTGAIADYTYALELNPDDAEIYKKRGKAKSELGDDAGRIADYNQYLKRNPQDASAYNDLADTKRKLGDYAGAIEDYTRAIKKIKDGSFNYQTYAEHGLSTVTVTPDDSYVYYIYNNRGWAKQKLGDHTGALEDFTQAIKRKPEEAHAYQNRGIAKADLNDHAGAVEDFTNAIKRKPGDPTAYRLRGHSKQELGQEEAAQIDFEKAKALESEHKGVRVRTKDVRVRTIDVP